LLIAGLGMQATGLAGVLTALGRQLARTWQVSAFLHGLGHGAAARLDDADVVVAPEHDRCGSTLASFRQTVGRVAPDAILLLAQPWKAPELIELAASRRPRVPVVVYMAIEGRPVDPSIGLPLHHVDLCVLYTSTAERDLHDLLGTAAPSTTHIGHGVDQAFRPLSADREPMSPSARADLRRRLWPAAPAFWHRPMVLNVNRAYRRKRLDLTLAGFALARQKVDASLYLHVAGLSAYEQDKLETQIAALGIGDSVMLNAVNPTGRPLPKPELIRLMNACEIGITTAMGEGWGLGSFEHAATGAAQIVPAHTSFLENWRTDCAVFFDARQKICMDHEAAEMYAGSPEAVAEALLQLLAEPAARCALAMRAAAHARSPDMTWQAVGEKFDRAIGDLLPVT